MHREHVPSDHYDQRAADVQLRLFSFFFSLSPHWMKQQQRQEMILEENDSCIRDMCPLLSVFSLNKPHQNSNEERLALIIYLFIDAEVAAAAAAAAIVIVAVTAAAAAAAAAAVVVVVVVVVVITAALLLLLLFHSCRQGL